MTIQPEWLRTYTVSLAGGKKYVPVLEGEHFAVIKMPGANWYLGCVSGSKYCQTGYTLIEKGKGYWGNKSKIVWMGRLTKEGMQIIKAALVEAEEAWE